MSAAEYTAIIARLGLSGAQCAEMLGYTRQIHYSSWSKQGPPQVVAMMLRLMDRCGYSADYIKQFAA